MISKLPGWVWIGGALLALMAGSVNAVGFLEFNQAVTHLTGSTTQLGIALGSSQFQTALHFALTIGTFFAGAVFSGFLIQESTLKLGRRYGIALLIESCLLFAAIPFFHRHDLLGVYLASCACGLQNGMVSTYSGAVIRTSHVSGIITDLGIFIGQFMRGIPVDSRRIRFGALLFSSFLAGGIAGTWGFQHMSYDFLYLPAALTGITGFSYSAYRSYLNRFSYR